MVKQTTFKGRSPFPLREIDIAPRAHRYVGKYYYDHICKTWDKVINTGPLGWDMQAVHLDGSPKGMPRRHNSTLWACGFADAPFIVTND